MGVTKIIITEAAIGMKLRAMNLRSPEDFNNV
jgi:hypothetical protein